MPPYHSKDPKKVGLTKGISRVFWENGFRTVAAVANADPTELIPVLLQAQPNKVRLEQQDELKYKEKLLVKARVIAESANRLWRKCGRYRAIGDELTLETEIELCQDAEEE